MTRTVFGLHCLVRFEVAADWCCGVFVVLSCLGSRNSLLLLAIMPSQIEGLCEPNSEEQTPDVEMVGGSAEESRETLYRHSRDR